MSDTTDVPPDVPLGAPPGGPPGGQPGAPAGFRLGDPISLSDLLSLPPDGRRYARDEQGRLALMAPDSTAAHRFPLDLLRDLLRLGLPRPWHVGQEGSIGFEPVLDLHGQALGPSRLGHKKLEPDLVVWEGTPVLRKDPRGDSFAPERLRLLVELTSPGTVRSDLGLGQADAVDRWTTYLRNEVPEYWVLNAGAEPCGPLPPFSGLFLTRTPTGWRPLEGDGLKPGAGEVHGLHPVTGGQVRSAALPELVLDLEAFWTDVRKLV